MYRFGTPNTPTALRVMMLGCGELGKEVIIALQRLGVEVIGVDRYANAPGMQVAHRSHVINMTDGSALKELGMPDEAMTSYKRALEINPDSPEAHYNLGVCLQSIGQLERAITQYRSALETNAEHVLAHNNLGGLLGGDLARVLVMGAMNSDVCLLGLKSIGKRTLPASHEHDGACGYAAPRHNGIDAPVCNQSTDFHAGPQVTPR